MSNTMEKSIPMDPKPDKKIPNLKDFIKYLDQTLNMFDHYVSEEDYNNKDSDVHKLFVTLFNMYMDMENKKQPTSVPIPVSVHQNEKVKSEKSPTNKTIEGINIDHIIGKHLASRKKQSIDCPKWENINSRHRTRVDSDKFVKDIYYKSLLDLKTIECDSPIIFDRSEKIKNHCLQNKTKEIEYNIYTENDSLMSNSNSKNKKYEKTDDIDQKIIKLKHMLHK